MVQINVSLRSLFFVLVLSIALITSADVARSAPSMVNLTTDTLIRFQTGGQDVGHDINVVDNKGGLRFYGCPELTTTPACAAIQFFGNGSSGFPGQLFIDSGSNANAAIIFRTAQGGAISERLRIDSAGRVKAGAPTSNSCDSPGDLCAQSDLVADGFVVASQRILAGTINSSRCGTLAGQICAGSELISDQDIFAGGSLIASGNVIAGTIDSSNCVPTGDVCAGTDLVADRDVYAGSGCVKNGVGSVIAGSCPSDLRLKQNIEPVNPVLVALTQLQPVTFDWREDEFPELRLGMERNLGLIAQQVEEILPSLVSENDDGYKMVHYEQLPVLMLQGMRELKVENDSLREQNASLEARLAAIEQRLSQNTVPLIAAR